LPLKLKEKIMIKKKESSHEEKEVRLHNFNSRYIGNEPQASAAHMYYHGMILKEIANRMVVSSAPASAAAVAASASTVAAAGTTSLLALTATPATSLMLHQ
jgi:hypothetical protein